MKHGTLPFAWHRVTVSQFASNAKDDSDRPLDPTTQLDFNDQVVSNIAEVAPGHQCYSVDRHEGIPAGTNATIQLKYWSDFEGENNGNNQSFFACADIVSVTVKKYSKTRLTLPQTFVETNDFSVRVPCFNVTSNNFNAPTPDASASGSAPFQTSSSANQPAFFSQPPGGGGISTSVKAGIAVGAVLGGLAILGAVGFFVWRKGKNVGLHNREAYELRAKNFGTPPSSKGP